MTESIETITTFFSVFPRLANTEKADAFLMISSFVFVQVECLLYLPKRRALEGRHSTSSATNLSY